MITRAEEEGKLTRDQVIVEASSGNTGISVAWVAALKGYQCLIVLPESASAERKTILRALGAEVVVVASEAEAVAKARELARNPRYFLTDQFANDSNWRAHYETTGAEIWDQTEGKITHVVAGIGTAGTLMGVGRRLRKLRRGIQIIGVEPSRPHHRQEGLLCLNAFCPEIFNREELDEVILVDDEDAAQTARDLFLREGLFVGISSGSTMFGAMRKAEELKEGVIVAIFGDHGFKYLSTGLFT